MNKLGLGNPSWPAFTAPPELQPLPPVISGYSNASGVTLNWNHVYDAGYETYMADVTNGDVSAVNLPDSGPGGSTSNPLSSTFESLIDGHTYKFAVRSVRNTYTSAPSNTLTFKVHVLTPQTPPLNMQVFPAADGTVTYKWSAPSTNGPFTNYRIFSSDSLTFTGGDTGSSATQMTVSGYTTGNLYNTAIWSSNQYGEGVWGIFPVFYAGYAQPAVVGKPTGAATSCASINLSWPATPHTTDYIIDRYDDLRPTDGWITIGYTGGSTSVPQGFLADGYWSYKFRVQSVNGSWAQAPSPWVQLARNC